MFQRWAMQPRRFFFGAVSAEYLTPLSSLFLHIGWLHIGYNLLFLALFGPSIEQAIGSLRFGLLFLLCGTAANLLQAISEPTSPVAIAGANFAISSLIGASIRPLQTNKPKISIPIQTNLFPHIQLPAILLILLWFVLQLLIGIAQIGTVQIQTGGDVLFGQISGFLLGFSLISVFNKPT